MILKEIKQIISLVKNEGPTLDLQLKFSATLEGIDFKHFGKIVQIDIAGGRNFEGIINLWGDSKMNLSRSISEWLEIYEKTPLNHKLISDLLDKIRTVSAQTNLADLELLKPFPGSDAADIISEEIKNNINLKKESGS